MNILLTVNLGGTYVTPNVMASHAAAAGRWGAEYHQQTTLWGGTRDVFQAKIRLHHLPLPTGARVCYIDGDALIRHDCPSPFDLIGPEFFGAVRCHQDGASTKNAESWWRDLLPFFHNAIEFNAETYFNGGLLIYTPAIHNLVWEVAWPHILTLRKHGPMVEQTALNMAVRKLACPVAILPDTFNRLGPVAWEPGPMSAYIQHLAHYGEDKRDRFEAMEAIDWRQSVEAETCLSN